LNAAVLDLPWFWNRKSIYFNHRRTPKHPD